MTPRSANCQPIAGATGTTYALTAADAGSTIRYADTAGDSDGQFTSDSVPTQVVTQPGGSSGAGGSGGGSGSGASGSGGSGGSGSDGTGGGGGTGGPGGNGSGTGVTITILPDGAVSGVELGSSAKWRVSLAVSPRRVHRHTLIKLTGQVMTAPRPPAGKLIYLQARTVSSGWRGRGRHRHRVTVYGPWISFATLRAAAKGTFKTTYRFRLGGVHRYQFHAVAPQEGGYRNQTGSSTTVTVSETTADAARRDQPGITRSSPMGITSSLSQHAVGRQRCLPAPSREWPSSGARIAAALRGNELVTCERPCPARGSAPRSRRTSRALARRRPVGPPDRNNARVQPMDCLLLPGRSTQRTQPPTQAQLPRAGVRAAVQATSGGDGPGCRSRAHCPDLWRCWAPAMD